MTACLQTPAPRGLYNRFRSIPGVTVMSKKSTSLILCGCTLFACFSPSEALVAAAADAQPAITVVGLGEVSAKPDMARVTIGVVTQAASASDSLRQNSAAVEKVFATLKEFRIADEDIQTSNFSIGPEYHYGRSGEPPRLTGYRVTNEVRVAVRRIADLGKLLDEVVAAGSNQVNQVGFDIDEAASLRDAARRLAIADARRKANLYAQEAGVQIGQVLSVEELSGPVAMPQIAYAMAEEARAVPIAPGRQLITQELRVRFAIEGEQ